MKLLSTALLALSTEVAAQGNFSKPQGNLTFVKYPFRGVLDRSDRGLDEGHAAVGTSIQDSWSHVQSHGPDTYDFSLYDQQAKKAFSQGKTITFRVITGSHDYVPSWIFSHGVTKVHVPGSEHVPGSDGTWPCYSDAAYKKYFHAMHSALKDHFVKTYDADDLAKITGIEVVLGSTGDVTPWHGKPNTCSFSKDAWFEYWADETIVLAELYKDWLSDKSRDFYIITRGFEKFNDSLRAKLIKAVPNSRWAESDHYICKEYNQNDEVKMFSMADTTYKITHTADANGNYVLSNCRQDVALKDEQGSHGDICVTQWQTILSMLTWGQDRVTTQYISGVKDSPPQIDRLWAFFNKYAGGRTTNGANYQGAWASLRVGLNAVGGSCNSAIAKYAHMGAKQDDKSINADSKLLGKGRKGMNDCGWGIYPGNYHMFLEQIDADSTSAGMWRVGDFVSKKPAQFFGRFARTFQHAKGMNDMYFQVTGGVFAHTDPKQMLNARFLYYDEGKGGFSFKYGANCEKETKFTKTGSKEWKEQRLTLPVSGLAKGCGKSADFVLHNTDTEDDAFAFVELSAGDLIDLTGIKAAETHAN